MGAEGVAALAACRTFIVIDVLSFSTCVSLAAARGAVIFPHRLKSPGAAQLAARHQAVLAGPRGAGYSLSPSSMVDAPAGLRLVLPSPNGATICLDAEPRGYVLAGCLRNVSAVCARAKILGGPFGIIPCGERWRDGSLATGAGRSPGRGAMRPWLLPGKAIPRGTGGHRGLSVGSRPSDRRVALMLLRSRARRARVFGGRATGRCA